MTPKESYRVARRSRRYDAVKENLGLRTYIASRNGPRDFPIATNRQEAAAFWRGLCLKWQRDNLDLISEKPDFFWQDPRFKWGATTQIEVTLEQSRDETLRIGEATSTWQTSKFLSTNHPLRLSMVEMAERQLDLMRQVNTLRPQEYLPVNHPARLTVQRAARVKLGLEPAFKARRHADVVLPPPVEYVKPQPLRRRKVGNEDKFLYGYFRATKDSPEQFAYDPPQFFMFDHMFDAEQSLMVEEPELDESDSSTPALELVDDGDWWETSKHTDRDEQYKPVRSEALSDPLVQLLQAEGSYDEASDLCRLHRAGFAHNSMNFYMQQRPDLYPQTLPGTVWVSQSSGTTAEVKPYIRTRRVKAA